MFLLGFTALICFVIIHSNGLWGFGALTATICWALGYWQITHRFRSDVTRPERVKATFFFPLGWLWTMTAGYVLLQLFAWTEPMRSARKIAPSEKGRCDFSGWAQRCFYDGDHVRR